LFERKNQDDFKRLFKLKPLNFQYEIFNTRTNIPGAVTCKLENESFTEEMGGRHEIKQNHSK
jgi:hypothetical protein